MNKIALLFIYLYKIALSPFVGSCCKFHPTCSTYAKEAFQKHFFCYALFLTLKRILKCNPFHSGGMDEVP
jgi:putative membrane protein insertion efficiency factor